MPDPIVTDATLAVTATIADAPRPLPDGWRWARLGDVCEQSRQVVEPGSDTARMLPYLGLEHVQSESGKIIRNGSASDEGIGQSATFYFDSHHVLYGKLRPYLNKVAVPDFAGRCTTELIPLLPVAGIERDYLAWLLRRQETVDAAMQEKTGSRMPRADMDTLLNLSIPLPPLAEQRRIAAILAARMAAVERARAAALAEMEAAQALPAAELRAIFESDEAQAWPRVKLGELGQIVSGITLGRKLGDQPAESMQYLRVANVKDGYLDLDDVYSTEATEEEISKLRLQWGDVLLTEGGDPDKLGRGTYWQCELDECIHQNHIFRVRFDLNAVSPQFVSAQIGSPYGKAYFLGHAKQTTGIATINQQVLRGFPLMLPPLEIQANIAAALDARMAEIARLRASLAVELDTINALPAALLRQAFNGEL